MSLKASIDIGTNSTRLLIADVKTTNISPLFMQESITRLGDGISQSGYLSSGAILRVIEAIEQYIKIGKKYNITEYKVFSTSTARDAVNQQEFIKLIRDKTGLTCEIISGDKEAHLSYLGVISDLDAKNRLMVCDIGGGSTEFIYSEHQKVIATTSVDIGSRRLTRQFLKSDPAVEQDIQRLKNHVISLLEYQPVDQIVCVGGTATTLGMMDANLTPETVHHHVLTLDNLAKITQELTEKTIEDRKAIPGLHPERADVILAGAIIVMLILEKLKMKQTTISIRDLLFGIFLNQL
ncbi:Ppx/GppA family phosphatase [candidate division KSB1 bacterium]|nr:Ppx/GppA family phosphatase [candidate division KSB1 bacterium]